MTDDIESLLNHPAPETWQDSVAWATRLTLAMERTAQPYHVHSTYRRQVIVQARRALDPAIDDAALLVDFPPQGGIATWSSQGATPAGIFRMSLKTMSADWREPMTAEIAMGVVQRTLDAELVEPLWDTQIVPEPPDGKYRHEFLDRSTYSLMRGKHRVAVYLQGYYPTARHVVSHILRQFVAVHPELSGEELWDFALWNGDHIVAAGHWAMDRMEDRPPAEQIQVAYFDGDGTDDVDIPGLTPWELDIPGWPSREQWEADGSDRIILRPKGDPAWDRPDIHDRPAPDWMNRRGPTSDESPLDDTD